MADEITRRTADIVQSLSFRDKWTRSGSAEKVFTSFISGSALLTLFTFCIGQFFQIRGVQHMMTSRFFLAGAWLILVAGVWCVSWLFWYEYRWRITIVASLILLLIAYLIDQAFPMPKTASTDNRPPIEGTAKVPTAEEIADELAKKIPGEHLGKTTAPTSVPSIPPISSATKQTSHPITRIGKNCPEQYKTVSGLDIAKWTMDEADKISDKSLYYLEKYKHDKYDSLRLFFANDFKKCCLQPVIDLRSETLCRLPPTENSFEESSKYNDAITGSISRDYDPINVERYAPHLRKLGVQLLRKYVPRHDPVTVLFSDKLVKEGTEITVRAKAGTISTGYIVLDVSGINTKAYFTAMNSDFGDFVTLPDETVANNELIEYLKDHPSSVAHRIESGHPLGASKPRYFRLSSSGMPVHVLRARVFDE